MGRLYDLAAWQSLRLTQLSDEPLCRHCKAMGLIELATDVDHITPISRGGAQLDQANLQSLCHLCHTNKTNRENGRTVHIGCGLDGMPLDPTHEWNQAVDAEAVPGYAKP